MIYLVGGVHPLDIPYDALTTSTWWDVMQWVADILDDWDEQYDPVLTAERNLHSQGIAT